MIGRPRGVLFGHGSHYCATKHSENVLKRRTIISGASAFLPFLLLSLTMWFGCAVRRLVDVQGEPECEMGARHDGVVAGGVLVGEVLA